VYAARGQDTIALMSATSNSMGDIPEALAYVAFFANHYDKVILRHASPTTPSTSNAPTQTPEVRPAGS
jgi:hypothetical protein